MKGFTQVKRFGRLAVTVTPAYLDGLASRLADSRPGSIERADLYFETDALDHNQRLYVMRMAKLFEQAGTTNYN